MTEKEFVSKIIQANGEAYLVGGYVRDLYMHNQYNDKDYVVCYLSIQAFLELFPDAKQVGNSFPVFLLNIDNRDCEIAFARIDRKFGTGYHGFITNINNVSIIDDLYRRDLTINALALKLPDKELIDPFNGINDIHNKMLRHISNHFCDDPVRTLRIARFAAIFNYKISSDTYQLMNNCKNELLNEPFERLLKELVKVLKKSNKPSIFFKELAKADLLNVTYPYNIDYALIDKVQVINDLSIKLATVFINIDDLSTVKMILPTHVIKVHSLLKNFTISVQMFFNIKRLHLSCKDIQLWYLFRFGYKLSILDQYDEIMLKFKQVIYPSNLKGKDIGLFILKQRTEILNQYLKGEI